MHQDKKREELEQKKEFERLQQEELFELEQEEDLSEVETEEDQQNKNLEQTQESQPIENEMERAKKRRREVIFEMALFFILGVLLGVTIKTEAVKKITIGFNDYQITKSSQKYDIAELKKALDEQAAEQAAQEQIQMENQNQPQQ
ncbi:MAG: hypothetical protein US57_C0006G0051 [Candidatus Moranbacteria bacterium GW2011_GWC2_37_73]|nr:MAG: hypothetical protein UR95_C0007G0054 [Parcubacteria group bacterium GW2011_GWC1_36_108]KKQ00860.1 MAG: hypothetical protein US09_C0005G0026 [Candidatus Moranbacteria bacterium GW2011_GWD1_36_198]KKQ01284.1 MAG: hypothetical protein US10_C0020G0005 [Candidatus Moranbacteria bacterium GW2011_GWD2_36_198]KKQ39979.1 MAG: hypothetical protein US57_C0006G0051 [Candidatus Moranbacteria bacterium GW2011_GWC2_37_73]HAR99862.1 hypothetical protein [Candidatus Moranbacteria bacterium]